MRLLTLNNKIVLLLFASVGLTLALVGTLFSLLLTDLYEGSARDDLRRQVELLRNDLQSRSTRLTDASRQLRDDPEILASVNLIWRYQDPHEYQRLLFNPEKRRLALSLAGHAQGIGLGLAVIYDKEGGPIAGFLTTSERTLAGYMDFRDGRAVPVAWSPGVDDEPQPVAELPPEIASLHMHDNRLANRVHFRAAALGDGLIMESVRPITKHSAGMPEQTIGWLRLAFLLGQPYVDGFGERAGGAFAIRIGEHLLASPRFQPTTFSVEGIEARLDSLLDRPAEPHWLPTSAYIEGVIGLDLEGGEPCALVFGLDRSSLLTSLQTFQDTVFWVLLLSGLMVIPMGLFFARRSVTRPIAELTEQAKRISAGEFPRSASQPRQDELGTLTKAFETMAGTVRRREEQLREKQRELEGIVENAPAVIYMKDPEGCYLLVNSRYEQLFGVDNRTLRGRTDFDIFPERYAERFRANDRLILQSLTPAQYEETVPHADGEHTYISIKFPLLGDDGRPFAICGISTDITERKRTENDLLLAKKVIENANEAIVITDLDGIIEEVNGAYETITGFSREEVIGKTPAINKSGRHGDAFYREMWRSINTEGRWEGEIWDRRKGGEVYPKWLSINTVRNDRAEPTHYVGIFSDITLKKATEEQLERLAYYDALTGLPNRLLFRDRLEREIGAARRKGTHVAVLFLDLDRFKFVNDTLGHAAGDQLLEIVAGRLLSSLRESDTVARLGGDEFTVVLPDIAHPEQVSPIAQKLIGEIGQPIYLLGQEVKVGASVGIALFPNDGEDLELLSRHADMALYQAKERGRNNHQFFSAEMQTRILERITLEAELNGAIQRQEFCLYYQPKIDIESDRVVGMESLIRWQKPDRGLVPPNQFIPLAEETGLIVPIGRWTLETACRQALSWSDNGRCPLTVATNLSAREFQQRDLVRTVEETLLRTGIRPECLELEITESMVMHDVEGAIATMRRLRDLGVRLAMDDFGTGYSSLNYLKRFPINTLKIDQSFVRDLTVDSEDAAIVKAIISMAHSLRLSVVAEGVETREQLEFLRDHGCKEVQGYLLSRPLPAAEFQAFIQGRRAGGAG